MLTNQHRLSKADRRAEGIGEAPYPRAIGREAKDHATALARRSRYLRAPPTWATRTSNTHTVRSTEPSPTSVQGFLAGLQHPGSLGSSVASEGIPSPHGTRAPIAEARYGAMHNDVLHAFCTGQYIIKQLKGPNNTDRDQTNNNKTVG
jgi:hypothetical protein